jgi:hypothetical protein
MDRMGPITAKFKWKMCYVHTRKLTSVLRGDRRPYATLRVTWTTFPLYHSRTTCRSNVKARSYRNRFPKGLSVDYGSGSATDGMRKHWPKTRCQRSPGVSTKHHKMNLGLKQTTYGAPGEGASELRRLD